MCPPPVPTDYRELLRPSAWIPAVLMVALIFVACLLWGCSNPPDKPQPCDNVKTGEHASLVHTSFKYWFLEDAKGHSFVVDPVGSDWRCG